MRQRLAMIRFDDGGLLALDGPTGTWAGDRSAEANQIATIADATPDVGVPAVWAAREVRDKLGGKLQILVGKEPGGADRIH